jgi:K(+)-stimulated pyrophosphate-energized sodium pump
LVATKDDNTGDVQGRLLWAIRRGIFSASGINILLGALIIFLLFDPLTQAWALFLCFAIGLISGVLIGLATEYYTSFAYSPTKGIAQAGLSGPAPVIIQGLSLGMISTIAPTIIMVVAIVVTIALGEFAGGQGSGVYGVAIAAVGMLSTLGNKLSYIKELHWLQMLMVQLLIMLVVLLKWQNYQVKLEKEQML